MARSDLEDLLDMQLRVRAVPSYQTEYYFALPRQYRADFCWSQEPYLLIVEVEGGIYTRQPSHSSITGIKRDIEKHNLATILGYRVLRFHSDQVRSGEAIETICRVLGRGQDEIQTEK